MFVNSDLKIMINDILSQDYEVYMFDTLSEIAKWMEE